MFSQIIRVSSIFSPKELEHDTNKVDRDNQWLSMQKNIILENQMLSKMQWIGSNRRIYNHGAIAELYEEVVN